MKSNKKSFFLWIMLGIVNWCNTNNGPFPEDKFVTNYCMGDGFGSQFQAIIAAAIYAELNNKTFLYTPFSSMEHNYDNSPNFIATKEWLINFIDNFAINTFKDIPAHNHKIFFDKNVALCANSIMLKKIKILFRANKQKNNYLDARNFNIAIHIRRPNPHDNRPNGTDIPNDFFYSLIQELRRKFHEKKPKFHIFSQGKSLDFATFGARDTILHLNESIEQSFSAMVLADVLVTCASSFSYVAGLLSDGIVYYIPFWHAPLPHWISINTIVPSANRYSFGYESF